eukprot:m.150909 g.150909  ORF g.150909 m.150909 type:complete len:761 (+) comp14277_c0_seq5:423-2705(+)
MSSRHSQSNLSEADLERADIRRSEMMAAEAKGLGDVRLVKTVNPKTLERDFGFTAVQKGNAVVIQSVREDGPARGKLVQGQTITRLNSVMDPSFEEVQRSLRVAGTSTTELLITVHPPFRQPTRTITLRRQRVTTSFGFQFQSNPVVGTSSFVHTVAFVAQEGPARDAGLAEGDILVKADETELHRVGNDVLTRLLTSSVTVTLVVRNPMSEDTDQATPETSTQEIRQGTSVPSESSTLVLPDTFANPKTPFRPNGDDGRVRLLEQELELSRNREADFQRREATLREELGLKEKRLEEEQFSRRAAQAEAAAAKSRQQQYRPPPRHQPIPWVAFEGMAAASDLPSEHMTARLSTAIARFERARKRIQWAKSHLLRFDAPEGNEVSKRRARKTGDKSPQPQATTTALAGIGEMEDVSSFPPPTDTDSGRIPWQERNDHALNAGVTQKPNHQFNLDTELRKHSLSSAYVPAEDPNDSETSSSVVSGEAHDSEGEPEVLPDSDVNSGHPRRKKALLIAISYVGREDLFLDGTLRDSETVHAFLLEEGFDDFQIHMINEAEGSLHPPTKAEITRGMRWLVDDAKAGDSLFLHIAGHGIQIKDRDGDELGDMMDECIVPMDYVNGKRATLLTDDELFGLMIRDLPQDVHLDIIMDCCHSGSGADLEWGWEGKNGWVRHSTKPARGGRVVCISGCEDAQLSTETNAFDGEPRGALTACWLDAVSQSGSYRELYDTILTSIREHSTQQPILSSNLQFNLNDNYTFLD